MSGNINIVFEIETHYQLLLYINSTVLSRGHLNVLYVIKSDTIRMLLREHDQSTPSKKNNVLNKYATTHDDNIPHKKADLTNSALTCKVSIGSYRLIY